MDNTHWLKSDCSLPYSTFLIDVCLYLEIIFFINNSFVNQSNTCPTLI